jgi:hypothetical protein
MPAIFMEGLTKISGVSREDITNRLKEHVSFSNAPVQIQDGRISVMENYLGVPEQYRDIIRELGDPDPLIAQLHGDALDLYRAVWRIDSLLALENIKNGLVYLEDGQLIEETIVCYGPLEQVYELTNISTRYPAPVQVSA